MSVDTSGIFINSGLTVISEDVIQGGKETLIDLMLASYLYNNSSQNSSEDNPGVELGQVEIPTRGLVPIPVEGNMRYSEFSMEFIVDEDLRNYMQIHNWMRALGTPQEFKERRVWLNKYADSPSEDPRFSDATLQVLNNNNIANFDVVFKDMFPVSLSSLPFDVTGGDNDYFTSTATFRYTLYEIRNKNTQQRR